MPQARCGLDPIEARKPSASRRSHESLTVRSRNDPPAASTFGGMDGGHHAASHETFAACFKRIRIRLRAKQGWLANEIGCTDAAISLWESGTRLPRNATMRRIFQALERCGALPTELVALLVVWRNGHDKAGLTRRTERPGADP